MSYSAQSVGYLSDCIARIRLYTDEPTDRAKYSAVDLWPIIRGQLRQVYRDIARIGDSPLIVRYDISVVAATKEYWLPGNVGSVLRLGKVDSQTNDICDVMFPRGRYNFRGPGYTLEGNVIRFEPDYNVTETLRVEYVPNGDTMIHLGTCAAADGSLTQLKVSSSPSEGYFDGRPNAYLGSVLRILSVSGSTPTVPTGYLSFPVQERNVTGFDVATNKVTVKPDFDFNLSSLASGTYTYELVPYYGDELVQAVAIGVSRQLHMIAKRADAAQAMTALYRDEMRSLRDDIAHREERRGGQMWNRTFS